MVAQVQDGRQRIAFRMRWSSFQVRWSQVSSSVRERLVVTSWAGYGLRFDDRSLDSYDFITAYIDDVKTLDIPEEETEAELVVVEAGDMPPSVDVNGVRVVRGDQLVDDLIRGDIREFRHRFNRDATFRETLKQELSEEGKQDVIDRFSEDHFVGDLIRETFEE